MMNMFLTPDNPQFITISPASLQTLQGLSRIDRSTIWVRRAALDALAFHSQSLTGTATGHPRMDAG
jgi:hypothetical protein